MAVEQGPMSGFRDMLAEQMIPRQAMLETIRETYEGYGFTPLKTPALELHSTLTGKYGEEGDKLMYSFEDNGGRMVALRYDQTVPLARVVAQYGRNLPMPYKRYAVGEVWRGERPQAGRYREFTQFDADTVGTKSPIADAEIIAMMSDSMSALGADSLIRVNNRLILDGLAERAGARDEQESLGIIGTIDKVEKIGREQALNQIGEKFDVDAVNIVESYLSVDGTPEERLRQIAEILSGSDVVSEGVENLQSVFKMLEAGGYAASQVVLDQTIARGLDYYTGIIYETSLKGAEELGSVCSGGRFDNLVEDMGGPNLPAVGTSIGVDRLYDGLQKLGILREAKTTTEALVVNFEHKSSPDYMRVATALRKAGVAAEVFYEDVKLGKQFRFADKMQIPYVILIGPDEMKKESAVVKTLESGEQIEVPLEELPDSIKKLRKEN
jgi:histidyl-tRNA synthetase